MAHAMGSPESKRIKRQKRDGGGEDRISRLPDDILLCVLEKAKDVRTTVRVGALSRRWRRLPWLLRVANLDVDDFCRSNPAAAASPEAKHAILQGAMAALTGTLRMFLAAPRSEHTVASLKLRFYLLSSDGADEIGELLRDAVDGGKVTKNVELAFPTEMHGFGFYQKQGKELRTSFNKLKKLFIHGIFVEFDLLWTLILLKAAPSVETFGIKVWDSPCQADDDLRMYAFSKRRHTPWNFELEGSKLRQLKRLEFGGFNPVTNHLAFIKLVMAHASNLETIALEDKEPCKICPYIEAPVFERHGKFPEHYALCSSVKSTFPKNKDEQDMIVELLRFEGESLPEIIFR